jgi:hypothetical protein
MNHRSYSDKPESMDFATLQPILRFRLDRHVP